MKTTKNGKADIKTDVKTSNTHDLIAQFNKYHEQVKGKELLGLKTGLVELDQRLDGLRGLTVLGGVPGSGKTSLCLQIATGLVENWATNKACVLYCALDQHRQDVIALLMSHLGSFTASALKKVDDEEAEEQIEAAREKVEKLKLSDRLNIVQKGEGEAL